MQGSRERQPLLRKFVRPIRGHFKGFNGYVKAIDNGLATVEIEAMQGKTSLIPVQDLEVISDAILAKHATADQREKTPEPSPVPLGDLTHEEVDEFGPLPVSELSPNEDNSTGN